METATIYRPRVGAGLLRKFDCFGTQCGVWAESGAGDARRQLLAWHDQFSRFRPDSELSRLNADPRPTVPVSETMACLLGVIARCGAGPPAGSSTARSPTRSPPRATRATSAPRSGSTPRWRSPRHGRRQAPAAPRAGRDRGRGSAAPPRRAVASVSGRPRAAARPSSPSVGRPGSRSTAAGSQRACSRI